MTILCLKPLNQVFMRYKYCHLVDKYQCFRGAWRQQDLSKVWCLSTRLPDLTSQKAIIVTHSGSCLSVGILAVGPVILPGKLDFKLSIFETELEGSKWKLTFFIYCNSFEVCQVTLNVSLHLDDIALRK